MNTRRDRPNALPDRAPLSRVEKSALSMTAFLDRLDFNKEARALCLSTRAASLKNPLVKPLSLRRCRTLLAARKWPLAS